VLLLDVTPLSLGIETLGGVLTKLIERNTTIPTSKKEIFSTASDSQSAVDIHVLQGEREMAGDNRTLGRFQLTGIPPAPRGVPQIEVSFDIDANGILNVNAKDLATSKEQSIEIKSSSGLSEDEIKKMTQQAEEHAEEDKKKRELVDTRNQADQLVYSVEKTLKEYGDKISDDEKKNIEKAMEKLREAAKGEDAAAIKAEMESLTQASHKLAQQMYEQAAKEAEAQAGAGAGPEAPGAEKPEEEKKGKEGEDVIDADFEVKE